MADPRIAAMTENSVVQAINLLAFAVASGQHDLTPRERAAIADLNAAAAQRDRLGPQDATWEPLPTA